MKNCIYLFCFVVLFIFIVILSFIFKKKNINESFTSKNDTNNLLKNSYFKDGKNIGKNEVIVFPNNGSSNYVIRQSHDNKIKDNSAIYYQVNIDLKPNKIYCLVCLYYSSVNNPLIYKIQFDKHQSIFLKPMNDSKKSSSNNNFKYYYCLFKTPDEDYKMNTLISFMYNFNNIKGYNFITDIGLEEVVETNNIPVITNLRCYLNAFNPESVTNSNKLIKDLSGNDFNFTASRNTGVQLTNIDLTNNKIIGPNAFKLQNDNMVKFNEKFSIFIYVKSDKTQITESFGNHQEEEEEEYVQPEYDNKNECSILKISGNQNTAIELFIPKKYGNIYLTAGGIKYKSDIKFVSSLENMLAITYNGERIFLYINDELILNVICPKIYFDNSNVKINPNSSFNGSLYTFAYYNNFIVSENVIKISKYFIKIKAIGKELSEGEYTENINDFIIPDLIQPESSDRSDRSDRSDPPNDTNCPKTIFDNDHYYVIIPNGSNLSKKIGYSGIRDYGTDIDNAKKIFEINFPKCPIPNILDKLKYKADLTNCPFIMLTSENPCNKYECRTTDWNKGITKDNNCKRSIDVYCSKYADVDPACYCWRKENRDKPACLKWRGNFEAEDKCDFRKFDINKHPDYKDYIKKNEIPCWGCNLDAPESTGEYSSRAGSGAR